jgi:hypothetical protein
MAGCGTITRPAFQQRDVQASASVHALDAYRFAATDERRFLIWMQGWTEQRRAAGLDGIKALGISGGGANGAYGAGVLVGWTRTGARPSFDVVTGVSTGALIAPLAFAGPAWDSRLTAAYHDPKLGALTRGWLNALVHPSLFSGGSLTRLVARYVDQPLLNAIASEHDKGRRLMVATTNLDSQESIIWDMGAIAKASLQSDDRGEALHLFRTILVASASIPGVFPPTLISLGPPGRGLSEMHVDGGVTTPFFLVPEAMVMWRPEHSMRPTDLYVIINGQLGPTFSVTRGGATSIVLRAFDTLGRSDARARITAVQTFAERNGGNLNYSAIPDDIGADPFNFDRHNLSMLFEVGVDRAGSGRAFRAVTDPPARR